MATNKVVGTKPKATTKTEVKEEVVTPEVKPKRVEVNRHDMVRVTNCTDSNVYFTSYSGFLIELPAGGTSMNITVEFYMGENIGVAAIKSKSYAILRLA